MMTSQQDDGSTISFQRSMLALSYLATFPLLLHTVLSVQAEKGGHAVPPSPAESNLLSGAPAQFRVYYLEPAILTCKSVI